MGTYRVCQDDISEVGTEEYCLRHEWNTYSFDQVSSVILACQAASFLVPWLCQGLLVSRVIHVKKLIPVLINEDDFHLFLQSVGVLSLGALKLAVECRDVP